MTTLREPLCRPWLVFAIPLLTLVSIVWGQNPKLETIDVEGQPLAANVTRVLQALDMFGSPLPKEQTAALQEAAKNRDAKKLQELLDPHVLVQVTINPESRVQAARGPATVALQQGGYTPILLKIVNDGGATKALRISSPQAGPILSDYKPDKERFLAVEMFTTQPMTANLSGLKVEYALALIQSSEAGSREATLGFDVGQASKIPQDLRNPQPRGQTEVRTLFTVKPAIPVKLVVKDYDGKPTTGRFTFTDRAGHVYPPQAKRVAPDSFFQQQVYRPDGGIVLLPPGELTMTYCRGPEYKLLERKVTIPEKGEPTIEVKLERWINPMEQGFFSGDHHIHAGGCRHYAKKTEGVFANDMFLHVKGEGLNVGCNLNWGPCWEFQHQFFESTVNKLSEPLCLLKYDVEVSGFGSAALGHVCLLNLREQDYPGSAGRTQNWPTWTTPLMRWAKKQGAYTGYAHSGSGLEINPGPAAKRLLADLDTDKDGKVTPEKAAEGLLPDDFANIDADDDKFLTETELTASLVRLKKGNRLPNLAVPEMNGIGAQEICVTTAQGLCDFISAMDTDRVPEWNCWYHIMNCGYPLKVSGETDFPCISGSRVGQGRVYVQLGKVDKIDYGAWCEGLAKGRSYVSDGYAHALQFTVNDKAPGERVDLESAGMVQVKAKVAFAAELPLGTSVGGSAPQGKRRLVELVVNGKVAASQEVSADEQPHELSFKVPITNSSWVALRHFPQMHTNPVNVFVAGKPIRASRSSARWCVGVIEQLWRVRGSGIAANERDEAEKTFKWAIEEYRKIGVEAPEGS